MLTYSFHYQCPLLDGIFGLLCTFMKAVSDAFTHFTDSFTQNTSFDTSMCTIVNKIQFHKNK